MLVLIEAPTVSGSKLSRDQEDLLLGGAGARKATSLCEYRVLFCYVVFSVVILHVLILYCLILYRIAVIIQFGIVSQHELDLAPLG